VTFEQQRNAAIQRLTEAGIAQAEGQPPLWRLFWRLGLNIPPRLFAGYWCVVLAEGLPFGLAWGLLMGFALWRDQMSPILIALPSALFASWLYGTATALAMAHRRSGLGLPTWREL
jgi:hypothetical protein